MADLFKFLGSISQGKNVYSFLSDEDKKTFQPFTIQRWLTGTNDPYQVIKINEVNKYIFLSAFYSENDKKIIKEFHSDLVFSLLTSKCSGWKKYNWIPLPGNSSISIDIISGYYSCSTRVAKQYTKLLDYSDLLEMAESLGYSKEQLKKLEKEFSNEPKSTKKPSKK